MNDLDRKFMQEAIDWADACHPIKASIPRVGAIIAVGEKIIGRGRRGSDLGGDEHHAERMAINSVSDDDHHLLSEATLYTTLEPCTKGARTVELESCSELICQHKFERVFVGMLDPNQAVTGKGLWRLQDAGIEVALFPHKLAKKVLLQNAAFIRAQQSLSAEIISPKTGDELATYETQGRHPVRFKCLNPPGPDTYLFTYHAGQYWPQRSLFRQIKEGEWEIDASFGSTGDHILQIVTASPLGQALVGFHRKVVDQNLARREKFKDKPEASLLGGDYPGIQMTGLPKGLRLEASVAITVARRPALLSTSAEPIIIARGRSLELKYDIESFRDIPSGMWLGASFRDKSNKLFCMPNEDKPISLTKGRNIYSRNLTIDETAPLGEQKLGTSLWIGTAGDSKKSTMVASQSPITITIVAPA